MKMSNRKKRFDHLIEGFFNLRTKEYIVSQLVNEDISKCKFEIE